MNIQLIFLNIHMICSSQKTIPDKCHHSVSSYDIQVLSTIPSLFLSSFKAQPIFLVCWVSLKIAVMYGTLGPLNIWVDVNTPATSQLLILTSSFDVAQWTHTSTHSDGNTLDLVFFFLCTLLQAPLHPFSQFHTLPAYDLLSFQQVNSYQ